MPGALSSRCGIWGRAVDFECSVLACRTKSHIHPKAHTTSRHSEILQLEYDTECVTVGWTLA